MNAAIATRRETWQAVALAALCSLLFLRTAVLPTRAVVPFAPEHYPAVRADALRHGAFDSASLERGNVAMGDKYNQSLAWDRIQQDRLRSGGLPLWTRDIAGGAPFVPQMAQVYEPWNLLLLGPVPSAGMYGIWFFLHQVLFGVFAWHLLRRLGAGQAAALLALTVAVLGLWTQARVHHNVILSGALPVFPLLALVHGAFHHGVGPGRIAGIAVLLGLAWSSGFAPVALQTTWLTGCFALLLAALTRRLRPLLGIGIGCALGALLAAAQMVPVLLAAGRSAREAATAAELAASGLEWTHLATLLWPDLFHWPCEPHGVPSWAALEALPPHKAATFNWPETAFAIGLPALLCLPLALGRRERALPIFFLVVAVLAFGIATASPPFLELTAVLPGARAGDLRRHLFLVGVAGVVLTGLGADVLARGRAGLGSASGVLGVLALGLAAVSLWELLGQLTLPDGEAFRRHWAERLAAVAPPGITIDDVEAGMGLRPFETDANRAALIWTFGRSALLALGVGLVLLFARPCLRVPALIALSTAQLVAAGSGTIVPVPLDRVLHLPRILEPVRAATLAAKDGPRPRLFRLLAPRGTPALGPYPPNLPAFHGLEDLAAYNPLPSRRMEELFAALEPGTPVVLGGAGVAGFHEPESLRHPFADLLGIRFVLADHPSPPLGDGIRDATPEGIPPPLRLLERTTTWPRATFVTRSVVVPDPLQRLALLADPEHDLRHTVVLEDPSAPLLEGGSAGGQAEVVEHRDELVRVRVVAHEPGYLRLADPYDEGWTATVNGERVPVLAADHYLRAVYLPPGEHEVVFRFDALEVRAPRWIALFGLAVVLGLAIAARRR